MDAQFGLASRDDLWRLQNEMKNVYATQAEHADRLSRLERDDSRLKSTWGGQYPFPSTLGGTPQHGTCHQLGGCSRITDAPRTIESSYNPAAEAFKNFDQDQTSNLLGTLHVESDDEPRRGAASRANSVRFDESALHGHFGHSRLSSEFLPPRSNSGIGSHPLTERSLSHKSDGRQSSGGHSTQSARASSFGFEPRPLSATVAPFVPLGPPPGLFVLGPVPSIIRCWLDTKFSNESLLYASICTGAYKSVLDSSLVSQLGFDDQIITNPRGDRCLKIPVYLPEATVQQASSRANSPAPQLPMLTVEFSIQSFPTNSEAIQIFLGCDVLRAQNADIHFSLDRMTLFDDERNKLSVPFVRPENANAFQSLRTTNFDFSKLHEIKEEKQQVHPNNISLATPVVLKSKMDIGSEIEAQCPEGMKQQSLPVANSIGLISSPSSVIGEGRKVHGNRDNEKPSPSKSERRESEKLTNGNSPEAPVRSESGNIWGSWRRDSMQNGRQDLNSPHPTSGYQRAGRGRGMKVLKPARLNTSRSVSTTQAPVGFDAVSARFGENGKGASQTATNEIDSSASSVTDRRSSSGDAKTPLQANKPRSANPIGGASAFVWMNSGEAQKNSPGASE